MNIKIEKAEINDLEQLSDLYAELIGEKSDITKMKTVFEQINSNDNCILLCAKQNDILLGSVYGVVCCDLTGECNPFMIVENVIVKSGIQNQGIGKLLMSSLELFAKSKNCSYIFLVSASHRTQAHQFYKRIGYNVDVKGFKKYL